MRNMIWGKETYIGAEPTADGDSPKKLTVETVDNHVYYYADVDEDRVLALMKAIREKDIILRNEHASRGLPDDHPLTPIWLHIQSWGGETMAGIAAADQLLSIKTPIHSVVEGLCASAGTLISCACSRRFITPSSFIMIHQIKSVMWGRHDEFQDQMIFMDGIMDGLIKFYSERTRMDKETVRKYLGRDSYFDALRCVELGLADEIRSI
jgi:ATP-dependent protease ClpP protease subunit